MVWVSSGLARVPIASMTTSQGISNSLPGHRHRPAPAGGVRLAQFHPLAADGPDPALLVAEDLDRVDQHLEAHALFLGVLDLLDAGGHFRRASGGRPAWPGRRPAAGRCARRPWRCCRRRPPRPARPRRTGVSAVGPIGAHQVDAGQVLVGRVDALEVLAGDAQEDRQAGPVGDEDGVEALLVHQFVDGVGLADDHVAVDLDAHACGACRPRPRRSSWAGGTRGCRRPARRRACAGPRRW